MKHISKALSIITRIFETVYWIGAALCLMAGLCFLFFPSMASSVASLPETTEEFVSGSLSVVIPVVDNVPSYTILGICCLGSVVLLGLNAMIFRNIRLIVKRSENSTPFQPDNVRMIREIGIFAIANPICAFIISVVLRLAGGPDLDISISFTQDIAFGLAMLMLTQYFARGIELEKDVEGLV